MGITLIHINQKSPGTPMQHTSEVPATTQTQAITLPKLANAAMGVVRAVVSPVQDDVYAKRIAICEGCDKKKVLSKEGAPLVLQCTQCGCMLNMKARDPGSTCPLGKW